MTTALSEPSHYLLRGGTLLKRDTVQSEPSSPKTIHYTHTVRMINGRSCQHEDEIQTLKQRFQKEISEKNQEIERLNFLLGQKELLLKETNEEMVKLKARERQSCLNKTWISSESQLPLIESIQDPHFHRRELSDTVQLLLPDISEALTPQILKVKQEMRTTIEALNNITNQLAKPKRKYQFYNNFEKQTTAKRKVASFRNQETDNDTRTYEDSNELNSTFIQIVDEARIYELQLGKGRDSDLDQTFDDDSQDNVTFIQRIMKEHIKLKETLIKLQQSTRIELQQMKIYYEKEIEAYIDRLNKQGEKGNEFNLNSTRTNIDQDNEQTDYYCEEEENEQYFQWGKENRFEIIFPEEEVLAPDIIE